MENKHYHIPSISFIDVDEDIPANDFLHNMENSEGYSLLNKIIPNKELEKERGQLWVLLVNSNNWCFGYTKIPMRNKSGGHNVREVIHAALTSCADGIITYQQKSTNENAILSKSENEFYKNLFRASEILDLKVHSSRYFAGNRIKRVKK